MPTEQRFKCDQCGTVGAWSDSWAWFGSILLSEEAPQHIIHVCSPKCAKVMQANIDAWNVKQPVAKPRGYQCKIVGKRVGY